MIGIWQLVLILAIVLVLFGAGKIPTIMKDLGSGLRAFKKGIDGNEDNEVDLSDELDVGRKVKKLINREKKMQKAQKNIENVKIVNKSSNKKMKNSKKMVQNNKKQNLKVPTIKKDNIKTQKVKVKSKKVSKANSKKK